MSAMPAWGTLYLVSTPIGNLEDITLRAIRILREADLIAAEDTRHTLKLLTHCQIAPRQMTSFHDHNARLKVPHLLRFLEGGKSVALVSDAGTPGISDPAFALVRAAVERGITIVPVPGASSLLAALVCSGLPTDHVLFVGFLPKQKGKREHVLRSLSSRDETIVCLESPHRIASTLEMLARVAPGHRLVIGRELTKLHEEFLRGTAAELCARVEGRAIKGECVLLFARPARDKRSPREDGERTCE